jgi:hypothetical protein
VTHETLETEEACAECAAAKAAKHDLLRIEHVVAGLRARQVA